MFMFSERSVKKHHSADRTVGGEPRQLVVVESADLTTASFRLVTPAKWSLISKKLARPRAVGRLNPAVQPKLRRWARYVGPMAAVCGAVAIMVALAARGPLVERAPALVGLYQAIGAPAAGHGISVEGLKARLGGAGERNLLLVEGSIVNRRETQVVAPDLRIALRDGNGEERYVWITRVGQTRLAPAERVKFSARLEAPPAGVVDAAVKIAGAGEQRASSSEGL